MSTTSRSGSRTPSVHASPDEHAAPHSVVPPAHVSAQSPSCSSDRRRTRSRSGRSWLDCAVGSREPSRTASSRRRSTEQTRRSRGHAGNASHLSISSRRPGTMPRAQVSARTRPLVFRKRSVKARTAPKRHPSREDLYYLRRALHRMGEGRSVSCPRSVSCSSGPTPPSLSRPGSQRCSRSCR